MSESRLELVFLWHMHQPDYRDHATGRFVMPWTLLHALKDYTDMAAHFERHPRIKAVVNFVPVLLDQIDDYLDQFATGAFRDPLLAWLAAPDLERLPSAERAQLFEWCFRCHAPTMLAPFPQYVRLKELYDRLAREDGAGLDYLSGSYLSDLVTWYFLAWTGETERRREPLLAELMAKGEGFTREDRRRLLHYVGRTLASLMPRYRALQERGQIELSATPQTHPLAPLLLDFQAARETLPAAELPLTANYSGGRARIDWHIAAAQRSHAGRFGAPPVGMWPAEGAISTAFVVQAAQAGCRWLASGENVLNNSLGSAPPGAAHRPWRLAEVPDVTLFFRDDRLSDLIGFEYAKWHGRDAAMHCIGQLEAIAAAAAGQTPIVCIALDGENAWEYYPYNGYYFLDDLYGLLDAHPAIRTRTFADLVDAPTPVGILPRLVAGSWVHGTFSTWIGSPAKNRAWDLLCAAKQSYDQVLASGRLDAAATAAAETQLAVCESSDWFWWLGDTNPAASVQAFDALFRHNLANLYRCLQLVPPAQLEVPIAAGRSDGASVPAGGTMRRAGAPSSQAT